MDGFFQVPGGQPDVLTSAPPDVLQFTPAGPQICVRPYCANRVALEVRVMDGSGSRRNGVGHV